MRCLALASNTMQRTCHSFLKAATMDTVPYKKAALLRPPAIAPVEDIVADLQKGKMVIVTGAEEQAHTSILMQAAEHVTAASINFMAKHACGLICLGMVFKTPAAVATAARYST